MIFLCLRSLVHLQRIKDRDSEFPRMFMVVDPLPNGISLCSIHKSPI